MIYCHTMKTVQECAHNFKVFRLVKFLHKLDVVDAALIGEHMMLMQLAKPAGIYIDFNDCYMQGGRDEIYQF